MTDNRIILHHGPFELELSPEMGGSILRFDHRGPGGATALLRRAPAASASVLETASFPLVPYVNRIRGGRFRFGDRVVTLQPNMAGDPSPLHGQGWLSSWQLVRCAAAEAELVFRHEPGEWPWAYEARQTIQLDDDGLLMRLACRNLSDEPMPCGLGFHPYFPCGPQTILDTKVEDVWTVDAQVLPVERQPASGRYSLKDRAICGQGLDNGYSGWGGEAWIRDPALPGSVRMHSADAGFFQVYSPREGGYFAAEPVGHANAALNAAESEWSGLGLRVLAAGEEMTLDARLDLVREG
jgi:aldose 1-epimerase